MPSWRSPSKPNGWKFNEQLRNPKQTAGISKLLNGTNGIMWSRIKNIFSSPEQKASRAGRLISIDSRGLARWSPRDYAALAREGYMRNAIVYRAVRLIAESIGSLSFVLYEGTAERDAHPFLDL